MLYDTNLPISAYAGTPRACGEAYGEEHRETIRIAVETMAPWKPAQWKYVAACMKTPWRFGRDIDGLTHGIARATGKTYLEIAQFYAHEELGRMKHCTAIAGTGPGTKSGKPILGMNWDGLKQSYPWARLVRMRSGRWPATLFYTPYPGLWCGAGMNEHGVSLVWTSADHAMRRRHKWPIIGVPTYGIVAGVLACRSSADARALLRSTPNAGGFIFFIGDATGDVMVVEAVPGKAVFVPCENILARANHLEDPGLVRESRQVVTPSTPITSNTGARAKRAHAIADTVNGRLTPDDVEAFLRDECDAPGLTICQSGVNGNAWMTIDSFYCQPATREFRIARGIPSRHRYNRVPVQA